MKKLIPFVLATALLLALTACGNQGTPYVPPASGGGNGTTAPSDGDESGIPEESLVPGPTEAESIDPSEPTVEVTPTAPSEPSIDFYSYYGFENAENYNNAPEDALSVMPYRVRWDGDYLEAECFIVNKTGSIAYDITVDSLAFSTNDVQIASAAFGDLEGVEIADEAYTIWTFRYSPEHVLSHENDISSLVAKYTLSYRIK